MKVIFMGSPEVAVLPLRNLLTLQNHKVIGIISQPARPAGRSLSVEDTAVAAFAKENNLPVFQPVRCSSQEFAQQMKAMQPDLCITAAYGQILSKEFLAVPSKGVINIHPSLLPKYRGATPVLSAIREGLSVTGVTILYTVERLDAGNIILQQEEPMTLGETAGQLTRRLFAISADLLPAALKQVEAGFQGTPQDESAVTHCYKVKKTDGLIDWLHGNNVILRSYCAYNPWPGSYTFHEGKRLNIEQMQSVEMGQSPTQPGIPGTATFEKNTKRLLVQCGAGQVAVTQLKFEGKKSVDAAAFWNGIRNRNQVIFKSLP